jgi:hypothetical protein
MQVAELAAIVKVVLLAAAQALAVVERIIAMEELTSVEGEEEQLAEQRATVALVSLL